MSTFDYYFGIDDHTGSGSGYIPPIADRSGSYTVIMKVGDTVNIRTEYIGSDANAQEIRYIADPNSSSTQNDPDATGTPGLDTTWSLTASDSTDHYARWYWFTAATAGNTLTYPAQLSVRLLILPSTFGFTGVPSFIGPGGSEEVRINVPSTLEPYLDGSFDSSADGVPADTGTGNPETFFWKISTDPNGANTVGSGFVDKYGELSGPQDGDILNIQPEEDCPFGTYYLCLYHYKTTHQYTTSGATASTTGGSDTLIQAISFSVQNDPQIAVKSVQKQSIEDSLVHLFELTLPSGNIIYLHNGVDFETGTIGENIYFPDVNGSTQHQYIAFPINIKDIETTGSGAQNRPTLQMANIPVVVNNRQFSSVFSGENYDAVAGDENETTLDQVFRDEGLFDATDLLTCRLVYRRTLLKHTYREGDAATLPTEYPRAFYYLERVASEDNVFVNYELISPADTEGAFLPARTVVGKYCSWEFQGALSGRGGCTVPKNSFGVWWDEDDNIISTDAQNDTNISEWTNTNYYSIGALVRKEHGTLGGWRYYKCLLPNTKRVPETNPGYWVRIDTCGKRLSSCRRRFQGRRDVIISNNLGLGDSVPDNDQYLNSSKVLPFGGFPGAKKFK